MLFDFLKTGKHQSDINQIETYIWRKARPWNITARHGKKSKLKGKHSVARKSKL